MFFNTSSVKMPRIFQKGQDRTLNTLPIPSEIDARKLLFFERLCRLDYDALPKKTFQRACFRLPRISQLSAQVGFIPDIMNLLATYDLLAYVHSWLLSGSFPTKFTWKRIVRSAIQNCGQLQRDMRIAGHSDFTRFREVFADRDPRTLWQLPSNCYEISLCKLICKLIANPVRETQQLCPLCGGIYFDVFAHAVCSCVTTNDVRNQRWDDITYLIFL